MMSQSIKEREKKLQNREAELKVRLEQSKDGLRRRMRSAGQIALVSGLVALIGYWIFRSLFSEQEPETETKTEKAKTSQSFFDRMLSLATPYIVNLFKEMLQVDGDPETSENSSSSET